MSKDQVYGPTPISREEAMRLTRETRKKIEDALREEVERNAGASDEKLTSDEIISPKIEVGQIWVSKVTGTRIRVEEYNPNSPWAGSDGDVVIARMDQYYSVGISVKEFLDRYVFEQDASVKNPKDRRTGENCRYAYWDDDDDAIVGPFCGNEAHLAPYGGGAGICDGRPCGHWALRGPHDHAREVPDPCPECGGGDGPDCTCPAKEHYLKHKGAPPKEKAKPRFMPSPCGPRDRDCGYASVVDLPGDGGTFMACRYPLAHSKDRPPCEPPDLSSAPTVGLIGPDPALIQARHDLRRAYDEACENLTREFQRLMGLLDRRGE